MKLIFNAGQMRYIDNFTSESIGIKPETLMERAALVCAEEIRTSGFDTSKILIVCGTGNNGADGLALARIINRFYKPDVYLAGSYKELKGLVKAQYDSAARSRVRFINDPVFSDYTLIIDALFGIGLNRPIEGGISQVIKGINESSAMVISVDMPSGIDATTGSVLGCAVRAHVTVSFAYAKLGQVLFPGAEYCGKLHVRDIGIYADLCDNANASAFYYTQNDLSLIPKRRRYSNKSSYGRVLVIAGSEDMSGAALLCARAAYKSGCGIVEVFTHESIAPVIRASLPEAIVSTYSNGHIDFSRLHQAISAAGVVLIGPGLSKGEQAKKIVRYTLESVSSALVIDADALNIISDSPDLLHYIRGKVITPHLGEMSRLTGKSISDIAQSLIDTAREFTKAYGCICVLKDTRTVVCAPSMPLFINTAGNSGLAKGGSGDTLTGIIASLISQGMSESDSACLGVYLHAYAADIAADEHGQYAMLASDVAETVGRVMAEIKQKNV